MFVAGQSPGQAADDVGLAAAVVADLEAGIGPGRDVAHGQQVEGEVVVLDLQPGGRGQDDVGVAGGLVDVDVDRDTGVQSGEALVELATVGRRQDRVPGHRDHAPDLALAGRQHLLAQHRDRQLATELRQSAHARVPPRRSTGPPRQHGVDRRCGEHRPAGAIEVAGQHVQHQQEPGRHGAERLGGGPDAAVGDRRVGRGEGPSHASDLIDLPPDPVRDPFRGPVGDQVRDRVEAIGERRQAAKVDQVLVHQHVHHRQQQQDVVRRPDRVVFVGPLGRCGAPRVDHHHPAASGTQFAQAVLDAAGRHQAAVGLQRVGPQDKEVVRAFHVRDREQQLVPEHVVLHELVGQLVDRRGREPVRGPQRPDQQRPEQLGAEVVGVGVAEVDADTGRAVLGLDRPDALGREVQRLLPHDLLPSVLGATDRMAQPVGVGVDVLERDRLGAHVATAEGVVVVATDGGDLFIVVHGHDDAAHGLAETAGALVGARHDELRSIGDRGLARRPPGRARRTLLALPTSVETDVVAPLDQARGISSRAAMAVEQ